MSLSLHMPFCQWQKQQHYSSAESRPASLLSPLLGYHLPSQENTLSFPDDASLCHTFF